MTRSTGSRPFRRFGVPLVLRLRWALQDALFALLCLSALVYVALLCIEQHLALVRWSAAVTAAGLVPLGVVRLVRRVRARRRAHRLAHELGAAAAARFAVRPCFRCYDGRFELLQLGPGGRSIHYACRTCGRQAWAPALTPAAAALAPRWADMAAAADRYRRLSGRSGYAVVVAGATAAPALPYEATRRRAIPADVRRHVWRRDRGACVQCGATDNLELDHVIPVARGGATTVGNLRLLCRACNARKGASV